MQPEGPFHSLLPAAAMTALGTRAAFGSGIRRLAALDSGLDLREALPRASHAILLPEALATLAPRPIYGRAPDAKTLAERGA
jgi:hypothetical protein